MPAKFGKQFTQLLKNASMDASPEYLLSKMRKPGKRREYAMAVDEAPTGKGSGKGASRREDKGGTDRGHHQGHWKQIGRAHV